MRAIFKVSITVIIVALLGAGTGLVAFKFYDSTKNNSGNVQALPSQAVVLSNPRTIDTSSSS